MRRLICILLALLASCSVVSCSGNTSETDSTGEKTDTTPVETETETEPSSLSQLEVKDLNGATYTMFDINGSNGLQVNIPGDELTGEAVNDAMINRDSTLEEMYNVVINYESTTDTSFSALQKLVKAGDSLYNLAVGTIFGLYNQVAGGYLYNMLDLPYMEMDQKWYSPLMAESLSIHDAMYVTASDICPSVYQAPCCMFLNLKLYEDYNIDTDIYQLVIDGEWTLDELIAIQKDMDRDLNDDNTWKAVDDFFGVAMQPTSETATAFVAGANAAFIVKDGDTLTLDGANERTLSILETLSSFCQNIAYSDINDVINYCFKEDKALFLQHKLESAATHLRDMESPYLVLPEPKADLDQDHYISMVSGYCTSFIGIPATAEPEVTGLITEAMARYSHDNMRSLAYDVAYKEKTSRDPRTAEVLDVLLDNLYIDFGILCNFGSINDIATNFVFKDQPFASELEKKRSSIETAMDKMLAAWGEQG